MTHSRTVRDSLQRARWSAGCVLLLASLFAVPAEAQLFLGIDRCGQWDIGSCEPVNRSFQLTEDTWAWIDGLTIEVRHRVGTLIGEPWEVSTARWELEDDAEVCIGLDNSLFRADQRDICIRSADVSRIEVDDLTVNESEPRFDIRVPRYLFRQRVRLMDFWYQFSSSGRTDLLRELINATLLRRYDGIIAPRTEWGWNVAGSPSWSRMLHGNYGPHGRSAPTDGWGSAQGARRWVQASNPGVVSNLDGGHRTVATDLGVADIPQWGGAFTAYNIDLSISGLLFEISRVDPNVMRAIYGRPRVALVASIAGSINAGAGGEGERERRQALLDRAVDIAGDLPAGVRASVDAAQDRSNGIDRGQRDGEVIAAIEDLMQARGPDLQTAIEQAQRVAEAAGESPGEFGALGARIAGVFTNAGPSVEDLVAALNSELRSLVTGDRGYFEEYRFMFCDESRGQVCSQSDDLIGSPVTVELGNSQLTFSGDSSSDRAQMTIGRGLTFQRGRASSYGDDGRTVTVFCGPQLVRTDPTPEGYDMCAQYYSEARAGVILWVNSAHDDSVLDAFEALLRALRSVR